MKKFTEAELKAYAEANSKTIVIRAYENGNSTDTERTATEQEREIIFKLIYGALLGINWRSEISARQPIMDSTEFTSNLMLPEANGYDTIYNRIGAFDWD